MRLEDARLFIGCTVAYIPRFAPTENGVITSVNDHYVFVRYGDDDHSKATDPTQLILLTP